MIGRIWRLVSATLVVTFAGAWLAACTTAERRDDFTRRATLGKVLLFYDMEGASGIINEAMMDEAQPDSLSSACDRRRIVASRLRNPL